MPSVEDILRAYHRKGAVQKERLVAEHHGPIDVPPSVIAGFRPPKENDSGVWLGTPGPLSFFVCENSGGEITIVEVVGSSLIALAADIARTEGDGVRLLTVGFQIEGYVNRHLTTEEEARWWQRGSMKQDFETNPGSVVSEALTTYLAEDLRLEGGDESMNRVVVHMISAPFHYDDGAQLVWEEPDVAMDNDRDHAPQGGIYEMFETVFKEVNGESPR